MRKGDTRRQQIVEMAEKLFYQKGYEQTSVQDIIDALHYSKGGFYHHFPSKLSLLEAICEDRAEEARDAAEKAVAACPGNAVDKLNALFSKSTLWQENSLDYTSLLIRVAYREDGALMRERIKQRSLDLSLPVMNQIVEEGVRDRLFVVPHADQMGALILRLGAQFTDEVAFLIAKGDEEETVFPLIMDKLDLYRHAIERILGAPFGSVLLYQASNMHEVCRALLRQKHSYDLLHDEG